ncbi:hypothetical protein LNP74_10410 [Klebsiella pneumoniae subsp. pneumoniae]|nr:hypothetical protein [Klebsiella pneumoniae subsp. pneumoniae]
MRLKGFCAARREGDRHRLASSSALNSFSLSGKVVDSINDSARWPR